ncbi:MAG TPA: hypothetical protein VFP50_05945 [Anaeromyxobacteraceae bacterium]|nr:hypothetical protein [Anaeromyxobacteraceae bacterium]
MNPTNRIAFALSFAALVSACSGSSRSQGSIGTAGGSVRTASGITLSVPAGALKSETEIRIVESEPQAGKMAQIELEPHGLQLDKPATLSFKTDDPNVKLAEVEHGPEGEVRTELQKHDGAGEVEVEVEHLGEVEMEHGAACDPACGSGMECDDGVCKPHVEDAAPAAGTAAPDDKGVDPTAAAPVSTAPASTPVVDDHGSHTAGHL